MTVTATNPRISYIGAGSAGPFAVPFYFLEDDDLMVIKQTIATGVEVTLALTADYTVAGALNPAGGSITLNVALAATHSISIVRNPDTLQSTVLPEVQKFPAKTVEKSFDKLTMEVQRALDMISRSIRLSDGDITGFPMVLPSKVDRASKVLIFDATGALAVASAVLTGAPFVNPVVAGQIVFGAAGGTLNQDAGLTWDNVAKKLTASAIAVPTLTATTSVVTPLVVAGAGVNLQFGGGVTGDWLGDQATKALRPTAVNDGTIDFGAAGARIRTVFATAIDSGTPGSLSLKTNNGQAQVSVRDLAGNAANQVVLAGGISTLTVLVGTDGTDANVGMRLASKGTGGVEVFTNGVITNGALASGVKQFEVLHTASTTSDARITGAAAAGTVGATLSTSDGRSLAITPAVVLGSSLIFSTAAGKIIPGATSISLRNNADNADNLIITDAGAATFRNGVNFNGGTDSAFAAGVQIAGTLNFTNGSTNTINATSGVLKVSGSSQLIGTTTSYTNNAGAQAATITNAPAAGNPTKWIPINDNGTTRNIPAW